MESEGGVVFSWMKPLLVEILESLYAKQCAVGDRHCHEESSLIVEKSVVLFGCRTETGSESSSAVISGAARVQGASHTRCSLGHDYP